MKPTSNIDIISLGSQAYQHKYHVEGTDTVLLSGEKNDNCKNSCQNDDKCVYFNVINNK